jgi:hypothetical protein
MNTQKLKYKFWPAFLIIIVWCLLGSLNFSFAQDVRWLAITDLQEPINSIGASYENEYYSELNTDFFTWPAQYGVQLNAQNTTRMEGMWIGCANYNDPKAGKILPHKVVATGPRNDPDRINEIFPVGFQLIAKSAHPTVIVDNVKASQLDTYDAYDVIDPTLVPDREVVVKLNTSVGISVTKKVMVFASPNHGNYYIKDFVFKNTGIYDAAGDVKSQTLDSVWFYWIFRYAHAGESNGSVSEGNISNWGYFNSTWGVSTENHDFGNYGSWSQYNNSASPLYQMRGFYTFYGPVKERTGIDYDEDWGCPAQTYDGRLGSWKYTGSVTLHADKSAQDNSDDISQPATTWFISSDIQITQSENQYDMNGALDRWTAMTEGHPPLPHDMVIGSGYAEDYSDPRRQAGGGTSQEQGFGPYTLAPGDSVHIVFAQAVSGLSRQKNLEVGANWLKYYNGTATPVLNMPDGSQAAQSLAGANTYKQAWVQSGIDSILKTYRNAINNYNSGYKIPMPPPPPQSFTVTSGGDRISLSWSDNADSYPHFNGYVIYRSMGTVMDPKSEYDKIFECDKSNLVHNFDDKTAQRGFDYYYYVQSKDDGTQNDVQPGTPLYSSMFWTLTNTAASLQRPAIPPGPLPFDTTYWKPVALKGAWAPSTSYSRYDGVSYGTNNYVCILDTAGSTTTPDIDTHNWGKTTSRGAWVSGTQYSAFNAVTYNSQTYFTQYPISGGSGLDLVRVVPNPYDIRARLLQFGDVANQADRIMFYGLPAQAKLKIFTERGDLVNEINHTSGTGDERWDCKTSSGQIVASGIYILYVERSDGSKVIRKFVIIR